MSVFALCIPDTYITCFVCVLFASERAQNTAAQQRMPFLLSVKYDEEDKTTAHTCEEDHGRQQQRFLLKGETLG